MINEAVSNGVYSLYNGWLKEPIKDDIPDVDLEPELSEWREKAEEAGKTDSIDEISKFIDDIYILRQDSILKDGEYGKGNLIFKQLRNEGILQGLKDHKVELENKEMSLSSEGAEEMKINKVVPEEEQKPREEWEESLNALNEKCIKEYKFWANVPEDAKLNEEMIDDWALSRVSVNNNYDYNDLKNLLFGGK